MSKKRIEGPPTSRTTALLTTPATDPPARGVIGKYRFVKPKSAPRSTESESNSAQALFENHISQPGDAAR
jgi:hypothetical protein